MQRESRSRRGGRLARAYHERPRSAVVPGASLRVVAGDEPADAEQESLDEGDEPGKKGAGGGGGGGGGRGSGRRVPSAATTRMAHSHLPGVMPAGLASKAA